MLNNTYYKLAGVCFTLLLAVIGLMGLTLDFDLGLIFIGILGICMILFGILGWFHNEPATENATLKKITSWDKIDRTAFYHLPQWAAILDGYEPISPAEPHIDKRPWYQTFRELKAAARDKRLKTMDELGESGLRMRVRREDMKSYLESSGRFHPALFPEVRKASPTRLSLFKSKPTEQKKPD